MPINTSSATRPTLGLALSGSGNRSSFYIGFLEVLKENSITIDYISACSGGSLVAAAFACGTLDEFKELIFFLNKDNLKNFFSRGKGRGGYFSLDPFEQEVLKFTKGLKLEEVRPLMGFVAVDVNSGNKLLLSMGDIARAVRISCTLPGVFEPVEWGDKTLVDGGLLTMVPGDFLRQAGMDVTVGIHMRGTKHIFTDGQISIKKVYNFFKKIFFVSEIDSLFDGLFKFEEADVAKQPNFFEVVGKCLDLAIKANKTNNEEEEACDLLITPGLPRLKQSNFNPEAVKFYYQQGRECAMQNIPEIQKLLKLKSQ